MLPKYVEDIIEEEENKKKRTEYFQYGAAARNRQRQAHNSRSNLLPDARS